MSMKNVLIQDSVVEIRRNGERFLKIFNKLKFTNKMFMIPNTIFYFLKSLLVCFKSTKFLIVIQIAINVY